jgi:hypothetical protein
LKIEVTHAEVITNIPDDDSVDMQVSQKGMAHIVGMLTNAYKDPMMAVIRENFTNGVDAHKKAGFDGPVHVTLPTWDKPNYVVTDNGVGMSKANLKENYGQYGDSTKTDNDIEAGGFGIGAKSGLAIASQFTVVSVKDGIKSVAIITKQAALPKLNVISSEPTNEPNGTIVTVPVKDIHAFNTKAHDFFQYVDPSTVLVNGKTPSYALASADVVTYSKDPNFKAYTKATSTWGRGASYVIMGNVPYSITEEDLENAVGNDKTVINDYVLRTTKYFIIPIGSVSLTLQREGLLYDDKTNAFIKDLLTKFSNALKEDAQAKADAATSFTEYFKIKRSWQSACNWNLTYKGKSWEPNLRPSETTRRISRSTDGSSTHDMHAQIRFDEWSRTFFVSGLKAEEYTKINNHLTPFLKKRNLTDGIFYVTHGTEHLTDDRTKDNDNIEVISFEDILKEAKEQRKIDRDKGGVKAEPKKLTYPVLVVAENRIDWIPYDKIPEGSAYATQEASREYLQRVIEKIYEDAAYYRTTNNVTKVAEAVSALTDFTHVTLVGRQRTKEAFLKRVPSAVDLNTHLMKDIVTEYKALTTKEVKDVAAYQNSNWSKIFNKIGEDLTATIADDTLKSLASPAAHVKDSIKKLRDMYNGMTNLRGYYGWKDSGVVDLSNTYDTELVTKLNSKYPLLAAIDGRMYKIPNDHIISYINAVQTPTDTDVLV